MSKALNYFNNVTFHLSIVEKMYTSLINRIEWPNPPNSPFRVLDVGCGSGRVLLEVLEPLIPKDCQEMIGIDINEDTICFCKELKIKPRVSFEVMNIEDEDIPFKFQNLFEYLFSSFALHYVRDMRRTLKNCSKLLKPKGELCVLFPYSSHPLYETYKRLYAKEAWKPYTMNYKNYSPILEQNNPLQDMKAKLNNEGFEVVWSGLNHDLHVSETKNFLALFTSMDFLHHKIPSEMKSKYEKDFAESLGEVMGISMEEKDLKKTVEMCFPTIMVHAKKH